AGAVATQSFTEPSYGPLGLDLMRNGKSAAEALSALIHADENPEVRQVAMVDAAGDVGVHTGTGCVEACGHSIGGGFSCQANMMEKDTGWDAMSGAFSEASGDLAERMLLALRAAEAEGGDVRGRQSAALLVVPAAGNRWDKTVDIRVEDSGAPLDELAR